MKNQMRCLCILLLTLVTIFGCASTTTLKSLPDSVKVYSENGVLLGVTPYNYWDRNISGMKQKLIFAADGYKSKHVYIVKNCLYIHRLFLPPVLALPWLLGYDPEYTFELEKLPSR